GGNLGRTAPVSHQNSASRSGREGARDSSSRGRDRGEGRGEGRSEGRSEARYVPVRPSPPKAPSDPLFSQPYVEKPVDPNAPPAPPAKPAARGLGILGISRKPAEVPALLGGVRKPEETT
ncbi:MAG: hypothetical protein ACO3TC_03245, partial [Burkholderiaceae bacterium]